MSFSHPLFRILIVIGIGAILVFQFLNLTTSSIWHDEAFSALLVDYEFSEMISRISEDVHPPLYYIILNAWTDVTGTSVLMLRLFSLVFGLLTIGATYLLAREIFQKKMIACLATIFLFFGSFQIQYNIEARMYTLATFFLIFSSFLLLRALKKKKMLWWVGYAVISAAAIYTHYYTAFGIIAQFLFVLYWIAKDEGLHLPSWLHNPATKAAFLSYLLVTILFLPWFPTFLRQLNQVQENFWIPAMNIWSIPSTLFAMLSGAGATDPSKFGYILIATVIGVIVATFFVLKTYPGKEKWILPILAFTPFFFSFLLSLKTSIYLDRYFILFLPPLFLILTAAIFTIRISIIRNILVVLSIIGVAVSFPMFWNTFSGPDKPGMAKAASYINERAEQEDKIFVGSSFVYFTHRYYNETEIHPLLYVPNELFHFSGTALLDKEDIIDDFTTAVEPGDVIWKIDTTGFGNFQPDVPESWKLVLEQNFSDMFDYRGQITVRKYEI